jgi:hypothetical protein
MQCLHYNRGQKSNARESVNIEHYYPFVESMRKNSQRYSEKSLDLFINWV